jgi:hypothetical protein
MQHAHQHRTTPPNAEPRGLVQQYAITTQNLSIKREVSGENKASYTLRPPQQIQPTK